MSDHTHHHTDAALVALVLAGTHDAFEPLLLRWYASVVRLCQRLLDSPHEAHDIAQEAALHAFLGLSQLRDPARFGAWFHAIAANLARMALRRRRTLSLDSLNDERSQLIVWRAGSPDPVEVATSRETHDAIIAALNDLSPVNRTVAIGFYLEGYSYAELATLLGVPISTVKGRLFFGRRQLRRHLRPVADELWFNEQTQRKGEAMVEHEWIAVTVTAMIVSRISGYHMVELHTTDGTRKLGIVIGPFEADAISMALAGQMLPRPMTHDLTLHLLQPLGGVVRQVTIHKLVEHTFYAEILLTQGTHDYRIDARPSDAIALAVRVNAPIVVARSVLDAVGVTTPDARALPNDAKARVMVVAAQPHTRDQLEQLLELHPAVQLVAQAATVEEFQTQVLQAAPQIVLVADDPPGIDAFAVTDIVLELLPTVRVVLLAPPDSEPDLRRAMRAGVRDVLVRPCSAEALYAALA